MMPEIGQFVIIYFRTGTQVSGKVVSWSDGKSIIESGTIDDKIIIQNTLQDVMFYKLSSVKEKYEKLKETPNKKPIDIVQLAELKQELNTREREEIKDKLITHKPSAIREITYGIPLNNLKISSSIKHTDKEIVRTDIGIDTELQDLFSKETKK